jgi:uncharacterized protein YecT (DUF1311 family)
MKALVRPATRLLGPALVLLACGCDAGGGGASAGTQNAVSQPAPEAIASASAPVVEASPVAGPAVRPLPVVTRPTGAELSQETIEAQYSPDYEPCLNSGDAAKGVSVAMGACVQAELKAQDERLNGAYKSAMAKRGPAEQAKLRIEERAWIKRRDAECEKQRTGGTIDMVEIPSCLLNETIRRRIALQPMAG